jgi:hypothetical protein
MGSGLSPVPLRLGPLGAPGFVARRSGMRWLCDDGHLCRPGEAVAYCTVGLSPADGPNQRAGVFLDEWQDVQAVLAPRVAGRIRRAETSSRGGFLDQLDYFQIWTPDFVLGHLEPVEASHRSLPGAADELDIFLVAGRRHAEIAEGRENLLTGWHDRTRAWRADGDGPMGAVLSLGVCEMRGVMRGDSSAFLELFEAIGGPAHVVHRELEPLVPSARVLTEQISRTPAQYEAIAEDLARSLAKASPSAEPADWIFAGALLNGLKSTPLSDGYDILRRRGLEGGRVVDAVVLSAAADDAKLYVHRRLGYAISIQLFRIHRAGPAIVAWIRENFDEVPRAVDQMASDLAGLFRAIRAAPAPMPRHILMLNRMSSSGEDDVQSYMPFDKPLGETLASIRGKDVNLMLHDLAREHEVAIVDADAIAAELGGQRNLPDGMHASGALQAEVRGEILHILRGKGVPGFGPALS